MRLKFILGFLVGLTFTSWGQVSKNCLCPKNQHAPTDPQEIFDLGMGNSIALCGFMETIDGHTVYSEFILSICGTEKIIDFWEANTHCKVSAVKDTLVVETLGYFPTGREFRYQRATWTRESIYFKDGKIAQIMKVNRNVPKYTREQIDQVLRQFESAKKESEELDDMLFIATISGNMKARQYFKDFETKFGPLDGAYAEDYKDLVAMLGQWDKTNQGQSIKLK